MLPEGKDEDEDEDAKEKEKEGENVMVEKGEGRDISCLFHHVFKPGREEDVRLHFDEAESGAEEEGPRGDEKYSRG